MALVASSPGLRRSVASPVCAVGYPDPSDVALNVFIDAVVYGTRAFAAAVGKRVSRADGSCGE